MKNMGSVCAVVVTHNRKELLAECLEALLIQTRPLDEIIVIDNASIDSTEQKVREHFSQVTYIGLPDNIGPAGAFHEGMKLASEKGYDWVWVMDDDSKILPDALEKLLRAKGQVPKESLGGLQCNSISSVQQVDHSRPRRIREVDYAVWLGFLIPSRVLKECGFPLREFFLYWDDIEYGERLIRSGFKIYKVSDSYIIHRDWQERHVQPMNVFFFTVKRRTDPSWRTYYIVRNKILKLKWQNHRGELMKFALWNIPKMIVKYILLGDISRVRFIIRATIDGVTNRGGKRVLPTNVA